MLLTIGWALIFQPALGNAITASSGATDTSWANAVYYSGYALTTLGVGDLIAQTSLYRLLTVAESAAGRLPWNEPVNSALPKTLNELRTGVI